MKRWIGLSSAIVLALALVAIGVLTLTQGSAPQAAAAPNAVQLAVVHLAPFAADPGTAVTVTVEGSPVPGLTDIEYGDSSQGYATLPAGGTYEVGLVPAGSTSPVFTKTLTVMDGNAYSAVAVGGANGQPLDILLLEDEASVPGNAKVRIGHLAPFASVITDTWADIRTQDGTLVDPSLDDVPFGAVTGYLNLPAGTYDLKVTNADGTVTLIDLYPVTLNNGDILSVFATGDGTNQPLGAFAMFNSPADTFLPLAASLQVAHLAPFPMSATTGVTVTLDNTPVLTDVVFADSTGYLNPIMADVDHEVGIVVPGSSDPVVTATINLMQAKGYTALAVGDITNQDLALLLLEDEMAASGTAKVRIGHLAPFASDLADTKADVRFQDGTLVAGLDDVTFGAVTGFLSLPPGEYDVKITDADNTMTLIDPYPFTLTDGEITSVFAIGDGTNQPLGAFKLPVGAQGALMPLAASLQVAHLAPFPMSSSTGVTVTLNSAPVLTDVVYGDSTGYLPVMAGMDYEVGIVVPTISSDPLVTTTINLDHAKGYAAVAYGGANMWDVNLMLLQDDPTPPLSGAAHVRFGHLAPFAATTSGTLADIRTQSGILVDSALNNVPYGAVTGYLELLSGTYDLKVTNATNTATLIDLFPVAFNSGDILMVFVTGDGTNQPLGAYALPLGQPGMMIPVVVQTTYMPVIFKDAAP